MTPLHVVSAGDGSPAALLCADMADAWFGWDRVAPLLADRHRVVRFDRPGLGLRPARRTYPTLAEEAHRIAAVISRLDLGRPVVVAHSAAALHAEAYARMFPDGVTGLVLVDPSLATGAAPRSALVAATARLVVRGGAALARLLDLTGVSRLAGPPLWSAAMRHLTARPIDPGLCAEGARVYGTGRAAAAALAELIADHEMMASLVALRRRTAPPAVPVGAASTIVATLATTVAPVTGTAAAVVLSSPSSYAC